MVLIPLVWVLTLTIKVSSPLTKNRFSLHQIKSAADYILFKGRCARLDLYLYKKTSRSVSAVPNKEDFWAVCKIKNHIIKLFTGRNEGGLNEK